MGVCVGDRESGARRQLALKGQCRLHVVGRAYSRTSGLYGLVSQRCERRGGGNRGEELRIGDDKLLLNDSVVALRGDNVGQAEAIVENTESGTQHGLGARAASSSGGPGNCYARREVPPVMDKILRFISESEIDSYVRTHLPFVAGKHSDVQSISREIWVAGIDRELRSSATQGPNLRRRIAHLLKQKRAAIPFDRLDGDKHRISRT